MTHGKGKQAAWSLFSEITVGGQASSKIGSSFRGSWCPKGIRIIERTGSVLDMLDDPHMVEQREVGLDDPTSPWRFPYVSMRTSGGMWEDSFGMVGGSRSDGVSQCEVT